MVKRLSIRLDDELAADAEALARAKGQSLHEMVASALLRLIDEDRERLERFFK